MIGSSSIRVHQHAGKGKKKRADPAFMGRSRGGLTTKIHALVDALGLPILLKLTEGQAHDGRSAADMLGTIGQGDILFADRNGRCAEVLTLEWYPAHGRHMAYQIIGCNRLPVMRDWDI